MTFRFSSTLAGLLAILMIAQQTLPLSAQTEDSIHQEDRAARKAEFTAAELQGLVPTPKPEDADSPKALVLALHASISGPMGPFDWNRFRSLFLPTACIGEAGKKPGGKQHITFQSVNDWIPSVQDLRPRVSVHETVYKLRIEQFGSIASDSTVATQKLLKTEELTFVALTAAKCWHSDPKNGSEIPRNARYFMPTRL
jgi:hypothetical protein